MSRKHLAAAGAVSAIIVVLIVVWWVVRPFHKNLTVPSAPAAVSTPVASPPDLLQQRIDGIVARYRQTIVLLEDDDSRSEADRDSASLVGSIIFQENHQ